MPENNFSFIESAILFGIRSRSDFQKVRFQKRDFAIFGEVFSFVSDYIEEHNEAPPIALLVQKAKELDESSVGTNLDYALKEFEKQVLFRRAVGVIREQQGLLKEDPSSAISNILSGLNEVSLDMSDDVVVYDSGTLDRLEKYIKKKELRSTRLKMLGLPTPFKTINRTGVGWMPGDLISLFARTSVGKSWLSAKTAVVATRFGYRTLFVSPELSADATSIRLDVLLAKSEGYKLSHRALRRGDPIDEEQYAKFLQSSKKKKLLISSNISDTFVSLPGIVAQVRRHRPDFLVVDGLELISSDGTAVWERMVNLFYGMKNLAVSQNIPCFVSTQAKMNVSDLSLMPRMNDVAYGAALIRSSDIAMSMSLHNEREDRHIVQFQKFRDDKAPVRFVLLEWDVDSGDIKESDERIESIQPQSIEVGGDSQTERD